MTVKDFTKLLTPNLELVVGDKTYSVEPPSKEDGKIMMALNVVGVQAFTAAAGSCEVCGRGGTPDLDPSIKALVDANAGRDLGELSLRNCYARMCEELDGPLLERLEYYAFYYWTLGEQFADEWLATYGNSRGQDIPKDLNPRRSGQNTGSAGSSGTQRKGTRSTPTTASRKK